MRTRFSFICEDTREARSAAEGHHRARARLARHVAFPAREQAYLVEKRHLAEDYAADA